MENSLKEILATKKKELYEQEPKWRQRRESWQLDIKDLYSTIEHWLNDLVQDSYITITHKKIIISEDLLGVYSTEKLIISFFNNQKVILSPKGLNIIGAEGRVDMSIGDRTIMIVRVSEDSNWTFAEREGRGKPKRWEFNENTFKELLAEFAEEF